MALIHIYYFSQALKGKAEFFALTPSDAVQPPAPSNPYYQRPPKTAVLLHGYTGGAADWLTGTLIAQYAGEYNLNVLMPAGGNSFYVDCEPMDAKWGAFIGEELPAYAEKTLGFSRTDMMIGGWSMGGYGAIRIGLEHPDVFKQILAFAPAVIFRNLAEFCKQDHERSRAYYETLFGDINTVQDSDANPEVLVKRLVEKGVTVPLMYIMCGTDDFLLEENTRFASFLEKMNVPHMFQTSPGAHDLRVWNAYIEQAIRWALADECV